LVSWNNSDGINLNKPHNSQQYQQFIYFPTFGLTIGISQRKVFLSAQPKAMVAKERTRDAQVFSQDNPVSLFKVLLQIPFTEVLNDVEWSTWGQLN